MTLMLAIKLQRIGRKRQPSYRVVVAERRSKMAAPPVEDLGSYNPFTKVSTVKKDRAEYWIKTGAQPTLTAHNLLVREGVIDAPKKIVKIPAPVPKAEEEKVASTEAPTETPAETSATKAEAPNNETEAKPEPVAEAVAETEAPKKEEASTAEESKPEEAAPTE